MTPIIPQPQGASRPGLSALSLWSAGGIALLIILGAGLAFWFYPSPQPVAETAAPEVIQADGSKVLPRSPNAQAKPKHQIPQGAKVERIEQITVQGNTPAGAASPCPPVTLDLSLVRLEDQTRRVITSSPDGQIMAGVDIPVEPTMSVTAPKWSAGLSFDPIHQTPGVWIDRDIERLRLGAELNQTRVTIGGQVGYEARLKAGWVFD